MPDSNGSTCGHSSIPITGTSSVRPLLSAAVHLLIFFVRFFLAKAAAFPRSDNSIFTYTLGLHYEPVSLPVPVTQHGRSEGKFLLNHTDCALTHPYISIWSSFRPVHSRIRQSARYGEHSNHGYFIDPWPIGNTSLPPDCFRPPLAAATVALSRCRGASYTACSRCTPTEGRRFRALPRHSACQIPVSNNGIVVCPLTSYCQRTSRTGPEGIALMAASGGSLDEIVHQLEASFSSRR